MNVFVVVVLAFATLVSAGPLTEEEKAKLATFRDECAKTNGLSADVIENVKKGVFPDDPKFREFLFCMAKKTGIMNDAGELQLDVLKERIGNRLEGTDIPKLVASCESKVTETGPERILKMAKCVYDQKKINLLE